MPGDCAVVAHVRVLDRAHLDARVGRRARAQGSAHLLDQGDARVVWPGGRDDDRRGLGPLALPAPEVLASPGAARRLGQECARPPLGGGSGGRGEGTEAQDVEGAPLVDVDGAGEDVGVGGGLVDRADDGAGGRVDDLDVAGGSAQVGEVAGALGASGVPEVSGGPALEVSVGDEALGDASQFQAKVGDIGRRDRYFGGRGGDVRCQHPRVGRVDDGGLDLAENVLRVAHQVRVQRVIGGDEHGRARRARATRASDLLAQGRARARPADRDRRVQPRGVQAHLQRRRRGERPHSSRADRLLERPALLGQVAAAIRAHPACVRGTTRREAVSHLSGHGLGPRARAHEGEEARPLLDESGGQVGGLDPGAAAHDRDLEGGRTRRRVEGLQEGRNIDLGLVGHDRALPQDQLVGARRRAVLGDGDRVAPRERAAHRRRVAHGRAQHDDPRIRAQVVGDAQQTAHDQRDVRAGHAAPMVGLVDDDEAQRRQETRPSLVRRQHHVVQEIGVRQDQVGPRARPLLRLARRVPVHGRRAHAAQPLIDET